MGRWSAVMLLQHHCLLPRLSTLSATAVPAPPPYIRTSIRLFSLNIPRCSITGSQIAISEPPQAELTGPPLPIPEEPLSLEPQIPIDRLFLPPELDLSELATSSSALSARVLSGSNIVLGNYDPKDAKVVSAEFVKSSTNEETCPSDGLPEFALVGRSNVGKSSLLNSLVRRKQLALTSKKPGKTQCINHFRVNDSWYLVDLPGYGYASAPQYLRADWNDFTKDYFLNRKTLVSVFLLIDACIPAKKVDLEYASWLGENQIPMTIIFTKCDRRKKRKNGGKPPKENVEDFQNLIRDYFQAPPPWIMTSSVTKQGRDEILLHIAQLKNYWLKH